MGRLRLVEEFSGVLADVGSQAALRTALESIAHVMRFDFFALANHVDLRERRQTPLLIHNYPENWAAFYQEQDLGPIDPIRRGSHRTFRAFPWSDIDRYITLSPRDRAMLHVGRHHGIGDGFTIPAHVPGEVSGSCSFVVKSGRPLPHDMLWAAELIGRIALERADILTGGIGEPSNIPLTNRQIECVMWTGRGKSDWEIGQIMGISELTVVQHQKMARDRYGVNTRTSLVLRALFDGLISFSDVFFRC